MFGVFVYSLRAGCRRSRKGTTRGVLILGGVAVEMWSSMRSSAATSVGEAKYITLAHGATESLSLIPSSGGFGAGQARLVAS